MYIRIVVVLLLLMGLLNCQTNKNKNKILRIATAANVQFAMNKLAAAFENQSSVQTEIVLGSSGKLTAQIQQGAPYHVFVSANMKYPNTLHDLKLTTSKPTVYALGKLVLWSTQNDITPNLNSLTDNRIEHIALANPKTAPYGIAATEVLNNLGIAQQVNAKLVFGESIAQTNQFILTKAADIGFTAKSVVVSPKLTEKGNYYTIPDSLYIPIEQGIVGLKHQDVEILKYANQFRAFMLSSEAQKILKEYGYAME